MGDSSPGESVDLAGLRNGAGACKTCAAVGPLIGPTPGLRAGGVTEPASTGKSSAFGTLCCACCW